jgi:AcrR family transcriptional regulator
MTRPPPDRAVQDAGARRDGKITREVVLTTALEIIDRDGADGLSMRRLALALDRDPMILYRHAPNKAALLDGVVETVLAQLKVDPADADWAGQLRAVARDYLAPQGEEDESAVPLYEGKSLWTAQVSARSKVRAGDRTELGVDTRSLHFFDPGSGLAIGGEATRQGRRQDERS